MRPGPRTVPTTSGSSTRGIKKGRCPPEKGTNIGVRVRRCNVAKLPAPGTARFDKKRRDLGLVVATVAGAVFTAPNPPFVPVRRAPDKLRLLKLRDFA